MLARDRERARRTSGWRLEHAVQLTNSLLIPPKSIVVIKICWILLQCLFPHFLHGFWGGKKVISKWSKVNKRPLQKKPAKKNLYYRYRINYTETKKKKRKERKTAKFNVTNKKFACYICIWEMVWWYERGHVKGQASTKTILLDLFLQSLTA